MDLKVIDDKGQAASTVAGSDELFGRDYNESLIHQLVTAYQANARSGTRAQKGRSDVNKSHKKPWAQKGTGRARAGQANSPLWRGGGKIFPSSPDENFKQKINRKMYRAGMASILSQLHRDGRLSVIDALAVEARMTCSLVVGRLSMPVDEALGLMTERRFRHLPVVEEGKLLGLVSIGDLVKVKRGEAAEEAQAMRAYIAS